MKKLMLIIMIASLAISCTKNEKSADANGNFEAREIILASESNGKIIYFDIEEGDEIKKGELIALVDTTAYYLNLLQAEAQKNAIKSKVPTVTAQINVLDEQNKSLQIERNRTLQMLKGKAATQQMLDNIDGKIKVNDAQIKQIYTQNKSVLSELGVVEAQILQVRDKINRCKLVSPITGVILEKYTEIHELTAQGKPMLKVADLSKMTLKVYVTATWLSKLKIGAECKVRIDKGEKDYYTYTGKIAKISNSAEFTPKTIEIKEERVNYVYAVEINVKNDGKIKIGMPGEVIF